VKVSVIAWSAFSWRVMPSGWYSGSAAPIVRLVQSNRSFQSSRGTPSIHAITAIGSGADTFSTKSHSPSSDWVISASTISLPICSMSAFMRFR
jgi:hypothetical protein